MAQDGVMPQSKLDFEIKDFRISRGPNRWEMFNSLSGSFLRPFSVEFVAENIRRSIWIGVTGLDKEDGSGHRYIIRGWCCNIERHPRIKLFYDAQRRAGHILKEIG